MYAALQHSGDSEAILVSHAKMANELARAANAAGHIYAAFVLFRQVWEVLSYRFAADMQYILHSSTMSYPALYSLSQAHEAAPCKPAYCISAANMALKLDEAVVGLVQPCSRSAFVQLCSCAMQLCSAAAVQSCSSAAMQ